MEQWSTLEKLIWMRFVSAVKEYSGAIVTFFTSVAKPLKNLIIALQPIQDLHGYDNPWPAGGGKNKLQNVGTTTTHRGITATFNADGTITLTGTNDGTNYSSFEINPAFQSESGVEYILSGGASENLFIRDIGASKNDYGAGVTFTGDGNTHEIVLRVISGYSISGSITVKPMICLSSASNPTTFAPYSNICPITGRTGANAYRTGKNLLPNIKTQISGNTVMLGQTDSFSVAKSIYLKPGTYTVYAKTTTACYLYYSNSDGVGGHSSLSVNPSTTVTLTKANYYAFWLYAGSGIDVDNVGNFQLEPGSTATAYSPYTGSTYPVNWNSEAGTVYGGTVDVVSGVLTVTHVYRTYDGTEGWGIPSSKGYAVLWGEPNSKSNNDTTQISNVFVGGGNAYANFGKFRVQENGAICVGNTINTGVYKWASDTEFKQFLADLNTAGTPLEVCYELATPLTYNLTPQEVKSLLGQNNVWSDSGDVTVKV